MIKYSIENSKENIPTLFIIDDDNNKKKYIHSKIKPSIESERFNIDISNKNHDCLIILGLGLAYHLKKLELIHKQFTKIIIIDAIDNIESELEKNSNYSWLFSRSEVIEIYSGRIEPDLEQIFIKKLDFNQIKGLQIVEHTGSVRAFPEYYSNIKKLINKVINNKATNSATKKSFGNLFIKNILKKVSEVNSYYPVKSLFNRFENRPALVISSAPSVDSNLKWIYNNQDKFLKIAVDSALPVLLKSDIKPDIIISIDPQPWIYEHFLDQRVEDSLIITSISAYDLYNMSGKKFLSLNSHPFSQVIDELHPDTVGSINSKTGNVAGDAINTAFLLGCNPIGIVGLDFSFPDYKIYSRGTAYQSRFLNIYGNRFNSLESYNINYIFNSSGKFKKDGKYSRKSFVQYKETIENLILSFKDIRDTDIFNINSRGLKINNCININDEHNFLDLMEPNSKVINNLLTDVDNYINKLKLSDLKSLFLSKKLLKTIVDNSTGGSEKLLDKYYKILNQL